MKKTILLLVTFCLSLSAQASLISNNDAGFGANSITTDTDSSLDWLDLTFSKGFSYNQLVTETSAGGIFDGFRLAMMGEVQSLFGAASLPTTTTDITDLATVNVLIDLIGATRSQGSNLETLGVTGTAGGVGSHLGAGLDFFLANGAPMYRVGLGNISYGNTFSATTIGGWLVRDSLSVPEPPEILLFVTGILGLFFARRKLKRGSSPVTS
ncbi:MAG: PEP-CTERM sorting domain-containing protein [Gammaproteobacteria bacterium]|nr:PEP-CTERM sorting domain-containing protein [Gammaproteobacteria bacterium]